MKIQYGKSKCHQIIMYSAGDITGYILEVKGDQYLLQYIFLYLFVFCLLQYSETLDLCINRSENGIISSWYPSCELLLYTGSVSLSTVQTLSLREVARTS